MKHYKIIGTYYFPTIDLDKDLFIDFCRKVNLDENEAIIIYWNKTHEAHMQPTIYNQVIVKKWDSLDRIYYDEILLLQRQN